MLVEINISITDAITNIINIIVENTVCLNISNFMFSFLLSFTMDLYNFMPLTAKARIAGINNIFCNNNVIRIKLSPFPNPIIDIHNEIVYPKQNPLYNIIPNTIGIPITVVPKNHIEIPNNKFWAIEFLSNSILLILSRLLNFSINWFK